MGIAASLTEIRATAMDDRERAMSLAVMDERIGASLHAIEQVLVAGHPLQCSFSGGKDSSLVVSLALEAATRLAARGIAVPPIHIVSVDTRIETPEVVYLRDRVHRQIETYALARGLPVFTAVVVPRLNELWWPRLIGGRKLPSYAGTNSDCSTGMKVAPLTRYLTALQNDLVRQGYPVVVSLMGTRFDESAVRGAAMRARGESAAAPRLVEGSAGKRLMLSPIADWTTGQVFCYLQNVGFGRMYPSFAPDFTETLRLYSDSAGAGCIIDVDPSQTSRGKGCGSRHGCHQCVRVQEDRSMRSLLMLDEYQYLRGLADLRNYLHAIRWDFSRRNWINRTIDPDTGDVRVFPNNFSPAECKRLLRMVLTLDRREERRAEQVRAQIEAGLIPDTERNRRMSRVQFRNLDLQQLVAIEFYWSQANFAPPFEVWRIFYDVLDGNEMEVPKLEPVPRPTQMPAERRLRGDPAIYHRMIGRTDASYVIAGGDLCGEHIQEEDSFDVDYEGAALFFQLELPQLLEETAKETVFHAHISARYYLRMGIVSVGKGQLRNLDKAFRQGQYLIELGLKDQFELDQLLESRLVDELAPQAASGEQLSLL